MGKVSKASVHYRLADLPDVRCGTCIMFHAGGTCDLVAGAIDAGHVCDRWQPRLPVPSGHSRENIAASAGAAVAAIYAAAEIAILAAIAHWVLKVLTGGLLAVLGLRRIRQAVTLITAEAEVLARQALKDAAAGIRADVEAVIRQDLASIGVPAGGAPSRPTSPERLHPPGISPHLLERVIAEILGRQPAAGWRGLPSLLHGAGMNVLREADDAYRQVIAAAMAAPAASRLEVAQEALDGFAERGVTAFTDTLGRRWGITGYTEMAVRTAASRMHLALELAAMRGAGLDLVLIVHTGDTPPCPACAPYVGHVLSMGELEQAQAEGLFHPACRCSAQPWSEGMDMPSSATLPPDAAAEYEAEQALRRHERAMRRQRRLGAVGGVTRKRQRLSVPRSGHG